MAASPTSPPALPTLNSITVGTSHNNIQSSPHSSIPAKRPLESSTSSIAASSNNSFQSSSSSTSSSSSISSSTVPSSVSTPPQTKKVLERNQACLSCRSRKRKCDGGKPTCSACERLERRCVYSSGGLSTVTKIHSSSFHAQKTINTTPNSSSRWTATSSANTNTEDPHPLPIHGPPPRNAQTPSSPPVLTTQPSASTATNSSSQTTFTPINQGSTSPTATISSNSNLQNGRSSYEPPSKRQGITEPSCFDAGLFAAQFLQASPFVGLDPIDLSWSEMTMGTGSYGESWSRKGDSPHVVETPESNGTATTLAYLGDSAEDLPPPETLVELVELFFKQVHPFLPCLYRKQVLADIAGGPLSKPCPLTYSIVALASYIHPDPGLSERSSRWHAAAKRGFDIAVTRGQYSLHNVQASIYICLYGFVTSEMAELWVFLAKAYRMCNPLGLHQIDSPRRNRFPGFLPHPKSEQDLEERRRAAWGIYVLNGLLSFSSGWPLVINDRDFCVNFPVDEEVFQSGEIEKMSHIVVEPFAHNLEDLITPATASAPVRGPYHYIRKLSVLLGRIVAYNNSPIPPADAQEFESLETTLARFRLSIPRRYRGFAGLSPRDLTHVTQLNLLLHVCTILLHHPTVPMSLQQDRLDIRESPSSSSIIDDGANDQPAFARCLSAVGNILTSLKTLINTASEPSTSLVTIDALQNPFITSALFLSARILIVRWLEGGREKATKGEIDLVLDVFERSKECWPELAGKYKEILLCDMKRERESVMGIKSGAGGYIGKECAQIYIGGMQL